jgi:hypothetical protein
MKKKEYPKFLAIRGCINCDTSKSMKERQGFDYGFDHELMAACLINGCQSFGYTIATPYIDIEEVEKFFYDKMNSESLVTVQKHIDSKFKTFKDFYDSIEVKKPILKKS